MSDNNGGRRPQPIQHHAGYPGLEGVKQIIAIASGKGGVGKSTVSSNLAVALKKAGAKVGLMDADIYGPSQPTMLGSRDEQPDVDSNKLIPVKRHGIKFVSMGLLLDDDGPVIWRAPMAVKMIHQFISSVEWGELDFLLIDLPPGTGDVQLTLAQQAPLTGAVIVTTPQQVALGVARKGLKMFQQVNVPILGIVENMAGFTCSHCDEVTHIFKEGGGNRLAEEFKLPFLGSIPLDPEIVTGGEDGVPVTERSATSVASRAFASVALRLGEHLEKQAEEASNLEPKSFRLDESGNLVIDWPDGHQGLLTPYSLRKSCPCASCIDEDTGKRILDPRQVPLDISITKMQPVGRYALAFEFSDHHNTGIYRYEILRDWCECQECATKRGDRAAAFRV